MRPMSSAKTKCQKKNIPAQVDVLKEKLETINFKDHFSDYEGENDLESVQEYIKDYFLAFEDDDEEMDVEEPQEYYHYTNATDTDLIAKVWNSVSDCIIQRHLKSFGLV